MIRAVRNLIFLRRHHAACRKLQRLVEQRRQSFETRDFAKRRAAALKGTRSHPALET